MECKAEWNTKTQARLDQLHYCSVELTVLSDPARTRGSRSVSKCENGGNSGDEDGGVDTSGKQTYVARAVSTSPRAFAGASSQALARPILSSLPELH